MVKEKLEGIAENEYILSDIPAEEPAMEQSADEDGVSGEASLEGADEDGEKGDRPSAIDKQTFIKQERTDKPYWYVVYTYSGYENKVMDNLLKTIENHNLQDTIIDVKVPMEESVEIKNGKKRHVSRKMFPGYVMVKMFLTDESWYVVRNTRGVTGFVGPSSKPIPLSDAEVRSMGIENVRISLDVEVGNNVIVTSGPLESFVGTVEEVNTERQKVHVLVSMFGRDTSVELDFVQIKRI